MIAFLAATTLVITAAYTLWLYKRVFFGEVGNAHVAEMKRHRRPLDLWCWACSRPACCCWAYGPSR